MLTTEELYTAAIIRTNKEWDTIEEALCTAVNSTNFFKILNRIAEAALRLPADSYAFNRVDYLYHRVDAVAKNKAALGVF